MVRFEDPKLLSSYKERTRCEWCSRDFAAGYIVAHHIVTRGAGGSDVVENLLGVDFVCHAHLQHYVPQDIQLCWQAWRLRVRPEQLRAFLDGLRMLDKSATQADVERLRQEIFKGAA